MRRILLAIIFAFVSLTSALAIVPEKKTVKEFLKMSNKDSTIVELTGVVVRVRAYDRGKLFLDDGTGCVLIYGVWDTKNHRNFSDIDVREGDTLTVTGRRFLYDHRVIEMKSGRYVRHSEGPDHANVEKIDKPDKEPTFKGKTGQEALDEFSKWVTSHVAFPIDNVTVSFIVGMDGSVLEPKVVAGSDPATSADLIAVMKKAPKWKPASIDNKTVRVTYTVPISFKESTK